MTPAHLPGTDAAGIGDARPSAVDVARWLGEDFGLAVRALTHVPGGADPAASVWRATTATGDDYAVKWSTRRTRTANRLVDSLGASGLDTTASALASIDGRPRVRRNGGRLSVTAWLGDVDAASSGLELGQWEAYGRLLSDLHEHRFTPPARSMRGLRRGIRRRRRRYVAGIRELDAITSVGSDQETAAAVWRNARPRIETLLAGTRLRPASDAIDVPCHGDPHLGNVLISPDGALRLIDWDEAVVAPREVDLHLVEFPVLFSPLTRERRAAFYRGYGEVAARVDEMRLVRFACVRALEDLVSSAQAALTAPDEDAQAEGLRVLAGILSPVGSASLVEPRLKQLRSRRVGVQTRSR